MANPLESGSESPAPPNPQGGNALQGAPTPAAMPASPSHQQCVAALRHFDAVKGELKILLENPALGKSSIKSAIIDGTSKLVSERFMSAAEAVQQLAQVPDDPLQQRKFLQQKMMQTVQSENKVLDDFGAGNPHFGTVQDHMQMDAGKRDDHIDHIGALMANYRGSGA